MIRRRVQNTTSDATRAAQPGVGHNQRGAPEAGEGTPRETP